jgi:hypothetical protein
MGASSVTGVGPGDSKGKFKTENNNGCGCNGKQDEEVVTPLKKIGCFKRYITGSINRYRAASGGSSTKVCS